MEAVRARVSFTCPGFLKQSSPARNPRFGRLCCGDGSVSVNPFCPLPDFLEAALTGNDPRYRAIQEPPQIQQRIRFYVYQVQHHKSRYHGRRADGFPDPRWPLPPCRSDRSGYGRPAGLRAGVLPRPCGGHEHTAGPLSGGRPALPAGAWAAYPL